MAFDPYKVLGVSKTANDEEIRKAYKKLVRANHPDVDASPEAARRFKEVTQAHEILSDAKRRSNYDQFGVTDEGGNWPPPPNPGRGSQSGSPFPFDLEELMGRRGPRPRGPAGGGGFGAGGLPESRGQLPHPRSEEQFLHPPSPPEWRESRPDDRWRSIAALASRDGSHPSTDEPPIPVPDPPNAAGTAVPERLA